MLVVRRFLAHQRLQQKMNIKQSEVTCMKDFFQTVENMGHQTYHSLVIQNASDISREQDRRRSETDTTYNTVGSETTCSQVEASKRIQERGVKVSEYSYVGCTLTRPRPHSDDYSTMKKNPPPKPKRSPNTKLSGSYEEISAQNSGEIKTLCTVTKKGHRDIGTMQRAASADGPHHGIFTLYMSPEDETEPVYIEMVGNARRRNFTESNSPEQGESVYEEMKYFLPDQINSNAVLTGLSQQCVQNMNLVTVEDFYASRIADINCRQTCDIPAPFPNLLPHRPPLLVFPPTPVTCSPASDESPLTPLEVQKLPVLETNLNYSIQSECSSPISPQYSKHQKADNERPASPALSVFNVASKISPLSTPPLPPPLPPSSASYQLFTHFTFPTDSPYALLVNTGKKTNNPNSLKILHRPNPVVTDGSCSPLTKLHFSSPIKTAKAEQRKSHSNLPSLPFNSTNCRHLTSPLDELTTLFNSGRSLLRKSTAGRRIRELEGKILI
ncbi:hypothetical protein FKM82_017734 [Ascaphus truei]